MDFKNLLWIIIFLVVSIINIPNSLAAETEYNLVYDANGNLIQGFNKYFEYNDFNQLIRVNDSNRDVIAEYFYDHNGNRIKKIDYNENNTNTTTYYIGKEFIVKINSSGTFNTTIYRYNKKQIGKKDDNGVRLFYHPDHIGSTSIVTNQSGEVVEETNYLPFGEITEGGESRFLFTGKEKDKNTGLHYYGARYYDSFSRHFIQPDDQIPKIYDPQSLNRYSYALNNPLKNIDEEGNSPTLVTAVIGAGAGAAISATVSAVTQYATAGQISWSDVGKSAAVGGVAGAVAGATLGLGTAVLGTNLGLAAETGLGATAGLTSGRAAQATSNVLSGNPITENVFDPTSMAIDVTLGGIIAGGAHGIKTAVTPKFTPSDLSKANLGQFKFQEDHILTHSKGGFRTQFRSNPKDFVGTHGPGPHINFESFLPDGVKGLNKNFKGRYVFNHHIRLGEPKSIPVSTPVRSNKGFEAGLIGGAAGSDDDDDGGDGGE